MSIDLKALTPSTSATNSTILFGAEGASAASPSTYTIQSIIDKVGAATSAAAAASSATAAATSATSASSSATSASASASAALAAANATGPVSIYATKAAANAALAGLANLAVVEVISDESLHNQRTRYQKVSGAYVFLMYMPGPPSVYVSSSSGSDANDGLSPFTPKATLKAAIAIAAALPPGTIYLQSGSQWYNNAPASINDVPDFSGLLYWNITSYDEGLKPIIDGAFALTGTWTNDGTYTNCWYLDVTFPWATFGSYAARSTCWHPALWDEATYDRPETALVTRVLNDDTVAGAVVAQTTQAGILAIVNANPGSFTVFKTGSSAYEPRSDNGTQFRYWINPRDGSNPNSNGRTVRTVIQNAVAIFGQGQKISNIVMQRASTKDMVGVSSAPDHFWDCDFLYPAVHAVVGQGVEFRRCRAIALYPQFSSNGGGGLHNFRPTSAQGTSRGVKIYDCEVDGFTIAVYSHGDNTTAEHMQFDVDGLVVKNCSQIFACGKTVRGMNIRRVRAKNIGTIITPDVSGVKSTIRDSVIFMSAGGCIFNVGIVNAELDLINCFIYTPGSLLFADTGSTTLSGSSQYPTINLTNTTIYGVNITNPNVAYRQNYNLNLVNSVVKTLASDWCLGTITADATSSLEFTAINDDDLRAARPGIVSGCLTGIRAQTYVSTVAASDFTYVDGGRIGSYSGTPDVGGLTASLTLNYNDGGWGRHIRMLDAYGTGQHYVGRVVSSGSPGTPLVVAPAPTGAFSNKTLQVAVFNRWVFRDPVTANISSDGTQAYIQTANQFNVGQYLNVGLPFGGGSFGLRKISAISGNVITFDTACVWKDPSDNTSYNPVDGSSSAYHPLPTVNLSWGLPIIKRFSSGQARPSYSVTPVEGGAAITGQQSTTLNAFGGSLRMSTDPAGVTINLNQGTNQAGGYNETGFNIAIGDTLTLAYDIQVSSERYKLIGNPAITGVIIPDPSTIPGARGSGYNGLIQITSTGLGTT